MLAAIVVLPETVPIRDVAEVAVAVAEAVAENRLAPEPPPPAPHEAPLSTMFPEASNFAQFPFGRLPLVVANDVVFPERVPTVGAAPAPPPITGAFDVSAAELAQVDVLEKYGTPPDVPATVKAA